MSEPLSPRSRSPPAPPKRSIRTTNPPMIPIIYMYIPTSPPWLNVRYTSTTLTRTSTTDLTTTTPCTTHPINAAVHQCPTHNQARHRCQTLQPQTDMPLPTEPHEHERESKLNHRNTDTKLHSHNPTCHCKWNHWHASMKGNLS